MKTVIIVVVALAVIFAIVQFYAIKSQKEIEKYPYNIVKTYDTFEIRSYEPTLFTSVKLTTSDYKKGSSQGFSMLAGYIFGGNDKNKRIAMTSPVSMSLGDTMTMMFMVPKKLKKEELPKPNLSTIKFREEPAKKMAVITFGGWATDKTIKIYKSQLIKALDKEGITYTNRFYIFGYNAPYDVLNRTNEVVVELE